MSKAIMCDRCGKFESLENTYMKQWRALERNLAVDGDVSKCLCPECSEAFDKFMAEKKS